MRHEVSIPYCIFNLGFGGGVGPTFSCHALVSPLPLPFPSSSPPTHLASSDRKGKGEGRRMPPSIIAPPRSLSRSQRRAVCMLARGGRGNKPFVVFLLRSLWATARPLPSPNYCAMMHMGGEGGRVHKNTISGETRSCKYSWKHV